MATAQTIERILNRFLTAYPLTSHEDAGDLLDVWVSVLDDVEDNVLAAVAVEYLKSAHEWRPAPGILRARALELAGGTTQMRALDAWQQIQASHFGRRMDFITDPLAARAMALAGGFEAFGQADLAQEEWWQKRFCQFYDQLTQETQRGELLALAGGGNGYARIGAGR